MKFNEDLTQEKALDLLKRFEDLNGFPATWLYVWKEDAKDAGLADGDFLVKAKIQVSKVPAYTTVGILENVPPGSIFENHKQMSFYSRKFLHENAREHQALKARRLDSARRGMN